MNTAHSLADSGFSYSREFFEHLVDSALAHAKKLGATDAGASALTASNLERGPSLVRAAAVVGFNGLGGG